MGEGGGGLLCIFRWCNAALMQDLSHDSCPRKPVAMLCDTLSQAFCEIRPSLLPYDHHVIRFKFNRTHNPIQAMKPISPYSTQRLAAMSRQQQVTRCLTPPASCVERELPPGGPAPNAVPPHPTSPPGPPHVTRVHGSKAPVTSFLLQIAGGEVSVASYSDP